MSLEKVEKYRPMQDGSAQEMEGFTDMLEVAVQNLRVAGRHEELGDGSLFALLQKKLTIRLVTSYNRWMYENEKEGTVETLLEWVMRETEFMVIGTKAVHGIGSVKSTCYLVADGSRYQSSDKQTCRLCEQPHGIWSCERFRAMTLSQRWECAYLQRLCYRCLGDDHFGQNCPLTRVCDIDSCDKTHHMMLHRHSA